MSKNTFFYVALALGMGFAPVVIAKNIDMYEQPNDSAKITGKINTEVGFVPIFTQKDGKWTKVGDPESGNTGWVKSAELSADTSGSFSYSQSMISKNGSVPSMVMRFGKSKPISQKELQSYIWKSREQQEAFQRDVQNMVENFFNSQPEPTFPYPMVLPVMLVPVQQDMSKTAPVPAKK